jgi:hypothetical protein
MDNDSIHTDRETDIVVDLLWHAMQVLVIFLPTRSPKLNPIALIFHVPVIETTLTQHKDAGLHKLAALLFDGFSTNKITQARSN